MKHLLTLALFLSAMPFSQAEITITPLIPCLCEGQPQQAFEVQADGSAGPFIFSWAGPEGYSSDEQNPEYARKISPHFPRKKLSPFPAFRFLYHQIKDKHYTRNRHFSVKQISVLQHAANQPFCWCNGNPLLVIPSVMQEMMPM